MFEAAYGSADLASGRPMMSDTICYIGSVSKQFTAAALTLAETEGALSLNDPLRRWVPELPAYAQDITLRHLVHHTSGLRDYFGCRSLRGLFPDADYTPDVLIEDLVRQRRLNFAPGERFVYSNTGYVLLTVVVGRATGVAFEDFARDRIFEPLGMADSGFLSGHRPEGQRIARAYDRGPDGSWKENDPVLGVVGDGGLRSTARDLLAWAQACMSDRLRPGLAGLLGERGRLISGHQLSYARGVARRTWNGLEMLSHGGGLGAWRSWLGWAPAAGLGLAIVANAGDVETASLSATLLRAALGIPEPDRTQPGPPVPSALEGIWVDDDLGVVLSIHPDDGGSLVLDRWGGQVRLTGDGEGGAVTSTGIRVALAGTNRETLVLTEAGDPAGHFRKEVPWRPEELAHYAGRYRSEELDTEWDLRVDDKSLRISIAPEVPFEPAVAETFVGGSTTLRFQSGSGRARSLLVDAPRTNGLTFVGIAVPILDSETSKSGEGE